MKKNLQAKEGLSIVFDRHRLWTSAQLAEFRAVVRMKAPLNMDFENNVGATSTPKVLFN